LFCCYLRQLTQSVREANRTPAFQAKELVESAPCVVKKDVPVEEADKLKKQLEEAGAKAELE
jgi:large subunit ribosomal protein L7/L12